MRKLMMALVVCCVALMFFFSEVRAQTFENHLNGIVSLNVRTLNSVDDGCWPNPKGTAKEIELELAWSKVRADKKSTTTINLILTGFEIKHGTTGTGSCAVSYGLKVKDCARFKTSYAITAKLGCYTIWSKQGIKVFYKVNAQSEANGFAVNLVREFLYDLEMDRLGRKSK